MCHSTDSRPPALPNPGEIARSGALELTSADGTVFSALEAIPAEPDGVRIVILPDIRDTHPYYQAPSVRPDDVATDVEAAAAHLGEGPLFTVGFCFGGGQSWRLAASDLGVRGVIGFYGLPQPATEVVDDISAPLLLLLAGADVATSPAEFDTFTARLDQAGKPYERQVYEGAPHSFFDAAYEEWQDACDDAWSRTLAFIGKHR
ncbi:dienelactone hydrolase family protein [Amycolatopsis sp. WQ 127309]|uniref:dienelactone hydrolase family protein n=1 Tax=Amycolatopsis sp. WQ 127309 TaxID=2932773 RepID=UPI001FF206F1|nr:dienelactone hydrolase family protein [Amycolatopsis sp. WQ 127309]UOZ08225.1 dienelactone hydrolase family protein [Amycolatopsis sp. WQ 127309]